MYYQISSNRLFCVGFVTQSYSRYFDSSQNASSDYQRFKAVGQIKKIKRSFFSRAEIFPQLSLLHFALLRLLLDGCQITLENLSLMTDVVPYVSRLFIHPIKSLDRVNIEKITVLKSGALMGDRSFAIFDESGNFVNGKRNSKIHTIRSEFDLKTNIVSLRVLGTNLKSVFHVEKEREALEFWLSEFFDFPVMVKQNLDTGFPDDIMSPGPTIISTATLEEVASWYPGLEVEEVRLRFRSNIEISGVPAFWEDRLFTEADEMVSFQVGDVQFMGVNPCQRCVVITRDSKTGEAYPNFQKIFVVRRATKLPKWTERSRFNHFYRLAINTRIPVTEEGKTICIGDKLKIHSSHP